MKQYFLILLAAFALVSSASTSLSAQDKKSAFDKRRIFLDGNVGFNFGSSYAYVQISPLLGYWITNRLATGVGPSFEYYKAGTYSATNYGGRVFGRYYPFRSFFAHAEYEIMNYKDFASGGRKTGSRLPIGVGYSQSLGGASINFMALYDVLYSANSPFGDYISGGWILRGGVSIGLGSGGWSPSW